jgi:hypothetical protein
MEDIQILKYYKPDFSELFIGFEFEYCPDVFKKDSDGNSIYVKHIFDGRHSTFPIHSLGRLYYIDELFNSTLVRVKKLDKEDIESLGFILNDYVYKSYSGIYDPEDDLTGYEYHLYQDSFISTIYRYSISFGKPEIPYVGDGGCIFKGVVKNKSELIRVLKSIGVPIKITHDANS